jgi:hypothetical protein
MLTCVFYRIKIILERITSVAGTHAPSCIHSSNTKGAQRKRCNVKCTHVINYSDVLEKFNCKMNANLTDNCLLIMAISIQWAWESKRKVAYNGVYF